MAIVYPLAGWMYKITVVVISNAITSFIAGNHHRRFNKKRNDASNQARSTDSSSISTDEMQLVVEKLQLQCNRSSTMKSYYGIWKNFNQFIVRLDKNPTSWEQRLVLYVGYLINNNRKSTTIKSYISAICTVLMQDQYKLREDTYLISSLTKACRYQNDTVKIRLPIQKQLFHTILDQTNLHFDQMGQNYLKVMYRAMFTAAYYGLLRVGEVTYGSHPVLAPDVHIASNKKKLLFILRTSKTHWKNNKLQFVKISSTCKITNNCHCPFNILQSYVHRRPTCRKLKEPFFVFADRSPVLPNHMRGLLKLILTEANIDANNYSTHSFRAGRSCDLLEMGLSVETIKKLGCWKSNAVFTYLR